MSDGYPAFPDAVRQFKEFARAQGVSEELLFVSPGDVILRKGTILLHHPDERSSFCLAEVRYRQAVGRGLGVLIGALCRVDRRTCAVVGAPSDEAESALLMYPSGLKLSIPQDLRTATPIGWWRWRALRLVESAAFRSMKEYLFK